MREKKTPTTDRGKDTGSTKDDASVEENGSKASSRARGRGPKPKAGPQHRRSPGESDEEVELLPASIKESVALKLPETPAKTETKVKKQRGLNADQKLAVVRLFAHKDHYAKMKLIFDTLADKVS